MKHPFNEHYFSTEVYEGVSFGRLSQYWWSNRYYAGLAKRHGPGTGRVLEIGCGLGHLLGWLARDYEVFGVDVNEWALAQAQSNVPGGHFVLASAEDLSVFHATSFQIVIVKHVIEHLRNPGAALGEVRRLLAPDGLLIFSTPNLDSLMRGLKKDRWVGFRDPTHISLKPPAAWLACLTEHELYPWRAFSDGFWDAPYVPFVPKVLQKVIFGGPGGLQAILGCSILPLRMGESMIVLARRGDAA